MTTEKTHGGRRPGAGRKATEPGDAKSVLLKCYVTPADAETIRARADAAGSGVSEYLADCALDRLVKD
jgi:hypothetical protein